jgi:hypothetical protein
VAVPGQRDHQNLGALVDLIEAELSDDRTTNTWVTGAAVTGSI